MSMDYPFYQELCRRKHRAAWWWIIGDRLYYLGLLPSLISVPLSVIALLAGFFGFGWGRLLGSLVLFAAGSIVFLIGGSLKKHSYDLAERDGITG